MNNNFSNSKGNFTPYCSVYDQAVPGTGPPGLVAASAPSVEIAKYQDSYNLSLRSKSDLKLNPIPEGFVKTAFPKFQQTREGIYALETDRGELSATTETQINVKGPRQFQNRQQDTVDQLLKKQRCILITVLLHQ